MRTKLMALIAGGRLRGYDAALFGDAQFMRRYSLALFLSRQQ